VPKSNARCVEWKSASFELETHIGIHPQIHTHKHTHTPTQQKNLLESFCSHTRRGYYYYYYLLSNQKKFQSTNALCAWEQFYSWPPQQSTNQEIHWKGLLLVQGKSKVYHQNQWFSKFHLRITLLWVGLQVLHLGFVPQMPKKDNHHTLGPPDLHYKTTFSLPVSICCSELNHFQWSFTNYEYAYFFAQITGQNFDRTHSYGHSKPFFLSFPLLLLCNVSLHYSSPCWSK
jgi:hypothetical protein